jgi:hypothetical protein
MSPETLTLVPPDPNGRFPHFIQHDAAVWQRFLLSTHPLPAMLAYDVHVGTPAAAALDAPAPYARMIETLSTKRIDVVMFFHDETLITEVKPAAGPDAIGQALCYTILFRRKWPNYPKPTPCIVTDTAQPDIAHIAALMNITLIDLDHLETMD